MKPLLGHMSNPSPPVLHAWRSGQHMAPQQTAQPYRDPLVEVLHVHRVPGNRGALALSLARVHGCGVGTRGSGTDRSWTPDALIWKILGGVEECFFRQAGTGSSATRCSRTSPLSETTATWRLS